MWTRGRGGVRTSQNYADFICGWPLPKVFHAVTVDQMRRHIEKSHHGVTFEELHLDFQCRICMEPERWVQYRVSRIL